VLVAVVLMAPRITHSEFGLFDDANSISVAQQTWSGEWDWRQDLGQYGRFRPVYWLAFSIIYRWAEVQPTWYFLGNLLLLSLTALMLSGALLRLTGRPLAAGVAGLAFVLGGPVIEATYTLSKPELWQCFLMVGAGATIVLVPRSGSELLRITRMAVASLLVLLAALTKETTGLLLIITPAWLAMAWLWDRGHREKPSTHEQVRDFMVACGLGIATYAAMAVASSPSIISAAGPRANFGLTWTTITAHANIWLDFIVRAWLYLLPLLAAAAISFVATRRLGWAPLMLGALIWMAFWLVLYLPYRFTPEYYLLPFSLGASVLAALLAVQVAESIRTQSWVGWALVGAGTTASAGLFLLTIPNNVSNAAIQLAVDKANADMLRFVAKEAPLGARVLVNIRLDSEYLWQVGPMLRTVYGRPDLDVQPYPADDGDAWDDDRPTFIVSPFAENVPYPSVRMGIPEAESRQWESALKEELGSRLVLQRQSRSHARLFIVDAPRLVCLAWREMDYCQRRNAPFDTRRFAAGWRIYALGDP
jgi:hypothetical protein